jgi:DNA modification methylase
MARRATSTSAFGVSRRENHDASGFYRRFSAPVLSEESDVVANPAPDKLIVGDARHMDEVPDSSVALVVTSPPYFAGKEYEAALGEDGVPATYLEYLGLLREVFAECVKKLEPGGRIAVNVANLGRRPYRSLSADVIGILQDDLRLLLRGEIIWVKQRASSGSCAWGSFQRPGNPVLRDLTERVVVASKGRFDRALSPKERARRGLPSEASMTRDDFMENTLDVWEIPPESATRVGHPAPFPVELPARLIQLYTYRGDVVLDPFVGSGSTAVAALRTGRHYVGYDTDPSYIQLAEQRVAAEEGHLFEWSNPPASDASAYDLAVRTLEQSGYGVSQVSPVRGLPEQPDLWAERDGSWFAVLIGGSATSVRPGLQRSDALWRTLGRASVLRETLPAGVSVMVVTFGVPGPGSAGGRALAVAVPGVVQEVVVAH